MNRYLVDWLDRPIAELTGANLVQIHEHIKNDTTARAKANRTRRTTRARRSRTG